MKEEVFGCTFTNIFHKFLLLFQLPSKYSGLQLYLCKPEGPFNLSSPIRGIVPEWDNQIQSLQCKQHLPSIRTLQGRLCTEICFLQQWWAPQTTLPERSWRDRSCSWKALCCVLHQQLGYHHWLYLVYNLPHCSQPHQKIPGNGGTWSRAPRGAGGEGKLTSSKRKERCRYKKSKNEIKRALKLLRFIRAHRRDKTRTEAGTHTEGAGPRQRSSVGNPALQPPSSSLSPSSPCSPPSQQKVYFYNKRCTEIDPPFPQLSGKTNLGRKLETHFHWRPNQPMPFTST